MTHGLKLSVLYAHPADPVAFEAHYRDTHLPLVAGVPGLGRSETAKGLPGPDGSTPPFYRLFEAWFDSPAHLAAVSGSAEWQRVTDDLHNFASGGVTVLLSQLA
ncbi:MAG: hypothetical protein AD742_15705 [Methylibium sp. NZG]|nr:MAG: hypothetical protein AD742_15705 [Methylibium sp. NZG]